MLFEVEQAANRIRAEVDPDANIIFGNTILEDMEGRIRVSVVATGIDAEQMRMPVDKVTPLRPLIKPAVLKYSEPRPVAAANPVHAQVEALTNELNAAAGSESEAYILGGSDAPALEPAQEFVAKYPATETVRATTDLPFAPKPEPEKKAGWSLFGRKKPSEMRMEPQQQPQPRAAAPVQRSAPAPEPLPPSGEDLFPEQARDEQFEIPAFLRRQSN